MATTDGGYNPGLWAVIPVPTFKVPLPGGQNKGLECRSTLAWVWVGRRAGWTLQLPTPALRPCVWEGRWDQGSGAELPQPCPQAWGGLSGQLTAGQVSIRDPSLGPASATHGSSRACGAAGTLSLQQGLHVRSANRSDISVSSFIPKAKTGLGHPFFGLVAEIRSRSMRSL